MYFYDMKTEMPLTLELDSFVKQNEYNYSSQSSKRIIANIRSYIEKKGISERNAGMLDGYLFSSHGDKQQAAEIIREFYRYLIASKGLSVDTAINDKRFVDVPLLRRIEIACFLCEPKTKEAIAEHFGVSERIIAADIAALCKGISFMGEDIRIIEISTEKGKIYESEIYPVFLPLNLSEVYYATVKLIDTVEMSPFSKENPGIIEEYRRIAERIYGQLSNYATERIGKDRFDRAGLIQSGKPASAMADLHKDIPLIRRIQIAKFLHKAKTKSEIMKEFSVSADTVKKDLAALREGISIMDSVIALEEKEYGRDKRKVYLSTVHPVFLTLSNAEAELLTEKLIEVTDGFVMNDFYLKLVSRVYSQLCRCSVNESVRISRKCEELIRENNSFAPENHGSVREALMYLDKRGEGAECAIVFKYEDTEKTLLNARVKISSWNQITVSEAGEDYIVKRENIREIITVEP